jgi:hypothetical protein
MTLDFALTCAETSVALSPGITDVVCNTNPDTSLDPATAQATSIQLLELDQFQKILRTDMITDVQVNGATIQYQSYIASSQTNQVDRVPGSLEIAIMARDATVTSIYQQLVIQFSNDCTVYPVFLPGQQIGWLKLVRSSSRTMRTMLKRLCSAYRIVSSFVRRALKHPRQRIVPQRQGRRIRLWLLHHKPQLRVVASDQTSLPG